MNADDFHPSPMEHKHKYSCALCPYSSELLSSYNRHLITHSNEKPFKCSEPECPFTAKRKSDISGHLKSVHQSLRPFPCPHPGCNYAAKRSSNLTEHSKSHSDEKSFCCSHPDCNFSTNHKNSLISHARVHTAEKPWVCQFESCAYATAQSINLLAHSRTHTKEKPFKCPQPNCEFSTGHGPNFRRHHLKHFPKPEEGAPQQSHPCPLCEYSGKNKAKLSHQITRRHTLEKLFKCKEPNCKFDAKTKCQVDVHKVVHSDEKPFVCSFELCSFRCKFHLTLLDHLSTLSDARRYKCELCPYRAKIRQAVRSHLRHVHSDSNLRPFKCTEPNCNYAAKRKQNLQQHLSCHRRQRK